MIIKVSRERFELKKVEEARRGGSIFLVDIKYS